MSLKNDIMYPFGDTLNDTFNERNIIALNNVLNLAKERVWMAEGRPGGEGEFSDFVDPLDLDYAKRSVDAIEKLLAQIQDRKYDS